MKICLSDGCDNYATWLTNYCASCSHTMRKAERNAKKWLLKPKRKVIANVSLKRQAKIEEYKPKRHAYLKAHPECGARLWGCTGKSEEIHHCSMSDLDMNNVSTWIQVCRRCHGKIENVLSAKERREQGFLI